ncbi:MAG: hypothetical protein AAGA56_15040 [Myxococcota bacterium]
MAGLLLSLGCEDPNRTRAERSALPPPPPGLRVDDITQPVPQALAVGTAGEESLRVVLPLGELRCEDLVATYPERAKAKPETIDFWLRQPWLPKRQKGPWEVRSSYATVGGKPHGLTTRGALMADVQTAPTSLKLIDFDFAAQDRDHLYQWAGDLSVEICGRKARPEEPRPQPDLKLSVSGRPIKAQGVTLRRHGKLMILRLTRAPHECASAITEGYDFYVDIALRDTEPPQLAFASLLGDVFPDEPTGSEGKEGFVVEPKKPLSSQDDIPIEIKGTLDLRGHALTVNGQLTAKPCREAPSPATSAKRP